MADFTVPITIPDAKQAEFLDAVRWHFDDQSLTAAQAKTLIADSVKEGLKDIFTRHKMFLREQQPIDDNLGVS